MNLLEPTDKENHLYTQYLNKEILFLFSLQGSDLASNPSLIHSLLFVEEYAIQYVLRRQGRREVTYDDPKDKIYFFR